MHAVSAIIRPFRTKRGMIHAAIIGALITLLAASGAGITFALWNAQASVTGSATAANLSITTANFGSNDFTFRNNALSVRSSVTITNTTNTSSVTKGDLGVQLDTVTDAEGIGADIRVRAWRLAANAACTDAPSTVVTEGTWATFPAISQPALLAAGASATYCIISSAVGDERSSLAVTDGSASIQPRITATLAVHNFTVSATATAQQQTSHIYPTTNQPANYTWYQIRSVAAQRGCVDVNGGLGGAGTNLIDFACKTGTSADTQNQDWQIRVASASPAYVTIVTRYNTALRVNATNDNGRVEVQTSQGAGSPDWQFQHRSASGSNSVFQIVNRANGLCLQSGTASGALTMAQCDGSTQQGYTLAVRGEITPNIPTLTCTDSAGTTAQTVALGWTEPAIGTYQVQVQKSTGTTWTTLGTAAPGTTSYTLPTADSSWSAGTRNLRVVFNSEVAASTTIWKGVTGSEQRLRCAAPTANVTGLACTSTPTGVTYAWNELALGAFTFQVRRTATSTNWTTIGTVTTGATSLTVSGTPSTDITSGTRDLRVMNGTTQISPAGLSIWKGQIAVNGAQVLQCAVPTPNFSALTCTNVGTNQVAIGWSHPAYSAYTIALMPGGGGTGADVATVAIGAASITLTPGSDWAAGVRTIRVSDGSVSGTIAVDKTGIANQNGQTHRLRCITANQGATTPPPAATPTKTAELTGTDGYYLSLLWSAQTVGTPTNYTVLLDGQPFPVVPAHEWSMDRLHLNSSDFAAIAVGDKVLQIFDGSTLVISQPLRITENANDPVNRAVFRR
jgi:hypothetical protein